MKMKPWIVVLALTPWIVGCGGAADDEAITEPSVAEHAHGEHNAHGHADDGSHSESGSHGGSHSESDSHGGSHSESGSHDGSHSESGSHGGSHSDHPVAEQPLPSGSKRPAAVQPKVKVKNGDGETAFSIKWKDDGAKMVDGQEQELARYNVSPGKMKVKDPDDQVLAYLVGLPSGGRVKVKDASQEKELFKLIRQDDGDWKLEDGADTMLVRIKKRDYGVELETPDDASLFKVKVKDGKTSLRNAQDKTVYYTNAPVATFAFACLGLEAVEDVRIRAALVAYLQIDDVHHH